MGLSKTPTYDIWRSLLRKCYEIKNRDFHKYGAKGITVCEKWSTFKGFYDDMGLRPEKHVLHLMFGSTCFNKENCKWITASNLHHLIMKKKCDEYRNTSPS